MGGLRGQRTGMRHEQNYLERPVQCPCYMGRPSIRQVGKAEVAPEEDLWMRVQLGCEYLSQCT